MTFAKAAFPANFEGPDEPRMSHVHFGGLEAHALKLAEARKPEDRPEERSESEAPRAALSYEAQRNVDRRRAEQRALRERQLAESLGMNAPALDKNVRQSLRAIGEPQTYFGEDSYSRRMRLRNIIAQRKLAGETLELSADMRLGDDDEDEQKEAFFTEGSESLREARTMIAEFSIPRALERNRQLRVRKFASSWQDLDMAHTAHVDGLVNSIRHLGTQQHDLRPLSCARFACDGQELATANWAGELRVWDPVSFEPIASLSVSSHRLGGVAWHPSTSGLLAVASGDGSVYLVKRTEKQLEITAKLSGHEDRVNQVEFHPLGTFLFSSSHDGTWRMWDLEGDELLLQEGHAMPVQTLALHPDGSLLVSGDTGGVVRVWDLRTGRAILALEGHAKSVVSCDVHPANGYSVATASDDHTVKIWDLRRRTCVETLLGHNKLVSGVKFEPVTGRSLLTSSFDQTVKLWSTNDWKCRRNLLSMNSPIHAIDYQCAEAGSLRIAAVAKNRMLSLWDAQLSCALIE